METQKNNNISDTKFIFELLEQEIDKHQKDICNYIETVMTTEEKNRHYNNLEYKAIQLNNIIDFIKLNMLADGRKIE